MTTTELTREQTGHLRHFANLLAQPPNDWSFMQGKATGQDDFGGYRFQLAYMTYAMALTHQHRLPAAPGVFKPLIAEAIEKMLLPEVWIYWKDTSRGGAPFNAHLSDKYREEYNPVARDNIMYSAYVQSMALLFNYLFDDDRYARPGDGRVVIGNLRRADVVVREGDTVIGRREGEWRSGHPDLRGDAEGLELTCRDDRPHRYTVTLTGRTG